jgi:nucleoside-diphosphate-sugar epimerase
MILITGANGLVGSYLCRYLLNKGEKIRALKRTTSDLKLVNDIKGNIEWVDGDILDVSSLEKAMEGIEKIYHCAALISYAAADRKKLMQINVEGTANVVNIALDKKIGKLLHVSSIAALGRAGVNGEIVTEDTPWNHSRLTSDYSVSKFLAEREVWRGIAEGLNAVMINPSVIVGAGNWNSGSCRLITTVHKGFKFYTDGITGYVDVRDVVKISCLLMQSDVSAERFIVNAEDIIYRDYLFQVADALNVKRPQYKAGKFLSGVAWRAEWVKSRIKLFIVSAQKSPN